MIETLLALLLLAASDTHASAAPSPDLAHAYNSFGFALLADVARENAGKNVFISPTSVATALAIAANGAAGTTRTAMLETLGTPGASIASFDASNQGLLSQLGNPGSDVQFTIANALWLNRRFSILPSFVSTSASVFGATAQDLPFGDSSAARTINAWVDKNTNGLIPEIVGETEPNDVLVITNAVAMKAKWIDAFEKSATRDAPFETSPGHHETVSMMQRTGTVSYADTRGWQVARLPYRGDRFAMYVFLPHEGVALHDAMQKLDATAFDRAIAGLSAREVQLAMPRYSAAFKAELNAPLSRLGMTEAFEPDKADFGEMVAPPQRVYVSLVMHRAFVRVDEAGTEAAAATAVTMRATAVRIEPPATPMIVDRPFFMAIRDDETKQILFLGAIYEPERAP